MAVTVITVTNLEINTASADLPDGSGVVATTPADGWTVAPVGSGTNGIIPADDQRLLLKLEADASGDTFTVKAGDDPPAKRAALGNLAVVLAASDVKLLWVEPARFMQSDGTILITCTDAGSKLSAFQLTRGAN